MDFMWGQALKGIFVGGFLGGSLGLGICIWIIPFTIWFPGDTILFGAVLGGILGFLYGESFFDWLSENVWPWFWRW